jgi:hypothetical protein
VRVSRPSRCARGDGGHAARDSGREEGADKGARMLVKREGTCAGERLPSGAQPSAHKIQVGWRGEGEYMGARSGLGPTRVSPPPLLLFLFSVLFSLFLIHLNSNFEFNLGANSNSC